MFSLLFEHQPVKKTSDLLEQFNSHSEAIDHFCGNIGHELNNELSQLLDTDKDVDEANEDYIERVQNVATYIECDVRFKDFMPLDSDELLYMSVAHLYPLGCGEQSYYLVTGTGKSRISKEDARRKASRNLMQLFKKIRLATSQLYLS